MLTYLFIAFGVLLRLLPHPPNFTPVAALALFGGAYLDKRQALTIPLAIMVLSDLWIGLHGLIWWTWGSFLLIGVLGLRLKKHRKVSDFVGTTLIGSALFFIITNFGVWISTSWYPHTLNGLSACYLAAIPFFKNTLLGDLFHVGLFFGAYELLGKPVEATLVTFHKQWRGGGREISDHYTNKEVT